MTSRIARAGRPACDVAVVLYGLQPFALRLFESANILHQQHLLNTTYPYTITRVMLAS